MEPVTELTLPFHTPSLYSGSRIRWKAVLEADNDEDNGDNDDDNALISPPHRGLSRLLQDPSAILHGLTGSQFPPLESEHDLWSDRK